MVCIYINIYIYMINSNIICVSNRYVILYFVVVLFIVIENKKGG